MRRLAALVAILALPAALALGLARGAEATAQAVACTTDNYADWGPVYEPGDCEFGTTITVTNALWFCSGPLSNLGTLPIRVVQEWTIATPVGQNGIELRTGCSGDGTPAIDLIVEQSVTGVGRISDPFKTRMSPGPQNVDMTGFLNATGPDQTTPGAGDHQDCMQFQGGSNNKFVNMDACRVDDFEKTNTQGAGGAAFYSLNNSQAIILGGEFIGCNGALTVHPGEAAPGSLIKDAKFRTVGPNKPDNPWCQNFHGPGPACEVLDADAVLVNVTCERWNGSSWFNENGGPSPPPPSPPPPSPPPPSPPPPSPPPPSPPPPSPPPPPYAPACAPTCDEQIAALDAERVALQAQVDQLQAEINLFEAEFAALQAERAELLLRVDQLQAEVNLLDSELQDARAQVAALTAQIDAKDATIAALQAKIAAAKAALE